MRIIQDRKFDFVFSVRIELIILKDLKYIENTQIFIYFSNSLKMKPKVKKKPSSNSSNYDPKSPSPPPGGFY